MSKKKIMISFRADEHLVNEIERALPLIDGVSNASELLRAALGSFIAKHRRNHEYL